MATGLVADWMPGIQPPWPYAAVNVFELRDRPPWERPTLENPWVHPESVGGETFAGSPGFEGGGIFTGNPGFAGGGSPGTQWIPGDPSDGGDGGRIVSVGADGGEISLDIRADRITFYTIDVYSGSTRIGSVPGWTQGTLKEQMDRGSTLNLTVPFNAEGVGDLVPPNTVWLRDRWGFVIGTFSIKKRKPTGTGDASYVEIECQSKITQLGEEVVPSYIGEDLPVSTHVAALLDMQEKADAIVLGDIDAEIGDQEFAFSAQDTTIHAALLNLQAALSKAARGHMYVDPQGRLQWRVTIGDTTEQIVTRSHNVKNLSVETDYSKIINKIYMYGEGQDPETRLSLIAAGQENEYIQNDDSIALYGPYSAIKTDRRIKDPETLYRVAARILEEFSTPPVTVSVDLLDLAKSDSAPVGWQDIYIGGKYRVVDNDLGIDESVEIVGITTNLKQPVPINVDLSNQTKTLSDLINTLLEALYQPLDVLGDFHKYISRNLSNPTTQREYTLRAGDVRWNAADQVPEMYDGNNWRSGGGWVTAITKGGLPDPSTLSITTLGRVIGTGDDNGMVCVISPDGTEWEAWNFFENE